MGTSSSAGRRWREDGDSDILEFAGLVEIAIGNTRCLYRFLERGSLSLIVLGKRDAKSALRRLRSEPLYLDSLAFHDRAWNPN
jgi:hypothetical protein